MAFLSLFISLPSMSVGELRARYDLSDRRKQITAYRNLLRAIGSGNVVGGAEVRTQVSTACSTHTITCAYASVVLDTTTYSFGGVTLTIATTPSGEDQLANGASNDALATNLAAAINAHSKLSEFCTAAAAAAVVTVTVDVPGEIGNHIAVAEASNGLTISGALPTGGNSDEMDEFGFGNAI